MRKHALLILLIVVVAVFAVIYFFFDPASSPLFPKCPFHLITGLKCPGCGSQRAIHALLQGDLSAAMTYNAMLPVSIPVIITYAYAETVRAKKPRLYTLLCRGAVIKVILAIIILWWVLRNLLNL